MSRGTDEIASTGRHFRAGRGIYHAALAAGMVGVLAAGQGVFAQNKDAPVQAITPVDAAGQPAASPVAPAASPAPFGTIAQGAGTMPGTAPAVDAAPVTTPAPATTAATPAMQEGKAYPITALKVDYQNNHPQQPPMEGLMNTTIRLGVLEGEGGPGYVAARPGLPVVTVKLSEIGKAGGPQKIYRSGIAALYAHIVRYFNSQNLIGVFVVVDSKDIDSQDNDIRPADRTALQLVVVTSTVKQVRTVSIGETADANRVDDPRFTAIRDHSPLHPAADPTSNTGDLLRKDVLDEYVLRLNRQPGRRVDVALSGQGDVKNPDAVTLDYLVSENRPWYAYGQISNTGTKQTNEWRERFGFVDNQLTGHDDVLGIDYLTAGFSESHAVIAAYEMPFTIPFVDMSFDRMRYKVFGSWNEFTASDVGQNKENFNGTQYTVGDEFIWNFFQRRELFVDLAVGEKYVGIQTDNTSTRTIGRANYYEPYIGLRLERATEIAKTFGQLTFTGFITDDAQKPIDGLGRVNSTRNPQILQFDINQSFYLEPILTPEAFAASASTLANELYFSARGQWAFNHRLFPQAEDVAGGLYSVRGYPESIVAGDSLIVATAEYRFHLPRVLAIQGDPSKTPFLWDKNFRMAPQQTYGRPDWDLILRAFVDVGQVNNSQRQSFEHNASLVGTGVGMEFQYKSNFNLRVDWGAALTNVEDEVKAGSNRFHISSTILY